MNDKELSQREIEEIGRVMDDLVGYDHRLEAPPEFVWDTIEANLDDITVEDLVIQDPMADDLVIEDLVIEDPTIEVTYEASDSCVSVDSRPHEQVVANIKQRRNFGRYLAAAALAVVAVIGLATFLNSGAEETVIASGDISNEGMPLELPASGTATLLSVDGVLKLDVDVEQLEADTGFFELWVATSDAGEVRSLGAIDGDGRFDLPADFDRDMFPAVAISLEEDDGNPAFGGVAVLFGVLES